MPGRDRTELRIYQRQKPLERAVIPLLPGPEILGDLVDRSMIQAGQHSPTMRTIRTEPVVGLIEPITRSAVVPFT